MISRNIFNFIKIGICTFPFGMMSFFASLPVYSQDNTFADKWIKDVKSNEYKGSMRTFSLLANTAREKISKDIQLAPNDGHLTSKKGYDYSAISRNFQEKYKNEIENADISRHILKANNEIVKGTAGLATTAISSTGLGVIAGAGLNYAISESLNYVEHKFEEAASESSKKIIGHFFYEYRNRGGSIQSLTGKSTEVIYKELFGKSPIFDSMFKNVSDQDKAYFYNELIKTLAEDVAKGQLENKYIDQLQEKEIEATAHIISSIGEGFNKFRNATIDELEGITSSQTAVSNKLTELNNLVNANSENILANRKDIEFIQEFMYGKMSPKEQLSALKSGWIEGLQGEERKKQELKEQILQERINLTIQVGKYLDGASTLFNFVSGIPGLGDQQFVKDAAAVVTFSQSALSAVTSFASGNYLGAIESVSSILGFGQNKTDIGGERHKQVMHELADIKQGISQLGKGIDVIQKQLAAIQQSLENLQKGQEQIMHNQQIILDTIYKLAEQSREQYIALNDKLDEMHKDIRLSKDLILAVLEQDITSCESFLNTRKEEFNFDVNNKCFNSYNDLKNHFERCDTLYNICEDGIANKLTSEIGFNPIFLLKNRDNVASYITKIYDPTYKLLTMHNNLINKNPEETITSLFIPSKNINNIDEKLKINLESPVKKVRILKEIGLQKVIHEPLFAGSVLRHVENFIEIQKYYELIQIEDGNKKLVSLNDLFDINKPLNNPLGLIRLKNTVLPLVDVAIAQEAMLSGDILLPIIKNAFRDKIDKNNDGPFTDSLNALRHNPLLARNFLVYYIKSQIIQKSYNEINYHFALCSLTTDEELKKIVTLPAPLIFHHANSEVLESGRIKIPKDWSLKIDDNTYISLPSAVEVSDGNIVYSDEMHKLISLKAKILDEIANYTFHEKLESTEMKVKLNKLLLHSL